MSVSPGRLDLNGKYQQAAPIRRGDTYTHTLTFVDGAGLPVSKAGVDLLAQVRLSAGNPSIVISFTTAITGVSNNLVTISLDKDDTEALTPGKYLWDLQEGVGGTIITRLAGEVLVTSDISRD